MMPDMAARMTATKIVWTATPPRMRPPTRRIASNRSRAMPLRSRIAAISTNIGTDTKTKLDTKV